MKFQTTLRTTKRQDDNLVQLIQHKNRLFQLDVHVDHSYHFQSYANLKNMTTTGKWEILTSFDVWNKFGGIDPSNSKIQIIKWKEIKEFAEKTITTYCKFIPKTENKK